MILYTVKPGDSLYAIAQKYKVAMATIIEDNDLDKPSALVVGQVLIIKRNSSIYTVDANDNLGTIAKKNDITISSLLQANPTLVPPYTIYPGEKLNIEIPPENRQSMRINGYAYSNSSLETLEKSMPYLTMLSIFSYRLQENGSLIPMDESALIELAKKYRVAPIMVVTNTKSTGAFNTDLASGILNSDDKQNRLIADIVETIEKKGYRGINIDFEYVYPKDKNAYIKFIKKLSDKVKASGDYLVSLALAPKYEANQQGLLYEAHDYALLSKLVDYIIIMTYEWGYTYGPAMPVAPINLVEKVIKYATSEMPSKMIFMGVPNYGYDFKLPYQKGVAAKSINNSEAVDYARKKRANIKYDEQAATPFFTYYDDDKKEHIVYFEDPRSIKAKSRLAEEYQLGGMSIWTISSYWQQMYEVMINYFIIAKI